MPSALYHRNLSVPAATGDAFTRVCRQIFDSPSIPPGVINIQLAPAAVIAQICPLAGNEPAIGLDLLQVPAERPDVLRTIAGGRIVLVGPFQLVQGGFNILGRLPIYTPDAGLNASAVAGREPVPGQLFWGFGTVTVSFPQLLQNSGLRNDTGYRYNLTRPAAAAGAAGAGGEGAVESLGSSPGPPIETGEGAQLDVAGRCAAAGGGRGCGGIAGRGRRACGAGRGGAG